MHQFPRHEVHVDVKIPHTDEVASAVEVEQVLDKVEALFEEIGGEVTIQHARTNRKDHPRSVQVPGGLHVVEQPTEGNPTRHSGQYL